MTDSWRKFARPFASARRSYREMQKWAGQLADNAQGDQENRDAVWWDAYCEGAQSGVEVAWIRFLHCIESERHD